MVNATIRGALPEPVSTENEAEGGTGVGVGVGTGVTVGDGVGVAVGVAVGVGTGLGFGLDVGVAVGTGVGGEVVAAVGATPGSEPGVLLGTGVGPAQAKPMVARRANNPTINCRFTQAIFKSPWFIPTEFVFSGSLGAGMKVEEVKSPRPSVEEDRGDNCFLMAGVLFPWYLKP